MGESFEMRTMNRRELKSLGLSLSPLWIKVNTKRELLRFALLSPRTYGNWQVAQRDGSILMFLVAKRIIPHVKLPTRQVKDAILQHAERLNIPTRKNYVALVEALRRTQTSKDPSRR